MLVSTISGGTHRLPKITNHHQTPSTRSHPKTTPETTSRVHKSLPHQRVTKWRSTTIDNPTIADYNVSWILIDQGSSYDIMYNKLFSKLHIEQERLEPYHKWSLAAFNGSTSQPFGCVELPNTFNTKVDHTSTWMIQVGGVCLWDTKIIHRNMGLE
jgi:hypothetical protein